MVGHFTKAQLLGQGWDTQEKEAKGDLQHQRAGLEKQRLWPEDEGSLSSEKERWPVKKLYLVGMTAAQVLAFHTAQPQRERAASPLHRVTQTLSG